MKRIILIVMFFSFAPLVCAEQILTEFEKALIELNSDNPDSALRRLQQIAINTPEHYRSRWLLIKQTVMSSRPEFVTAKQVNDEVNELIQLAIKNNDIGYAHFIRSGYAYLLKAYDTALKEIELAIVANPDLVLFSWTKANILVKYGSWSRDNDLILAGIEQYKKANKIAGDNPPPYFKKRDYHFKVAYSLGRLKNGENCPQSAINHYLKVTELSKVKDSTVAYAWNNISCAYRKAGQCDKAKEASQNALDIMEFRNAEINLRYSEFCLKMQRMGLWEEQSQTK